MVDNNKKTPKFKVGDKVSYTFNNTKYNGIIRVVDNGIFRDENNIYYDIIDDNLLLKHVPESICSST